MKYSHLFHFLFMLCVFGSSINWGTVILNIRNTFENIYNNNVCVCGGWVCMLLCVCVSVCVCFSVLYVCFCVSVSVSVVWLYLWVVCVCVSVGESACVWERVCVSISERVWSVNSCVNLWASECICIKVLCLCVCVREIIYVCVSVSECMCEKDDKENILDDR